MNEILKALNQRPIAYYPLYKELTGSLQGAVLLSQLMYWFSKKDTFYKSNKDFMKELCLTIHEIKTAKKAIKKLPFISTARKGVPATTYYTIDWDKYSSFVAGHQGNKGGSTVGSISTNLRGDIQPTNSKNTTETTEFTKVNSPTSGHGGKPTIGSRNKRDALKQKKKTLVPLNKLHAESIELIEYWNSFDTLTTHTLTRKRNVSPLHQQTKTIQSIDASLFRLLKGTFYSKHESIQAGLKKKQWSVASVKKAIERMALACSIDYTKNPKRMSFINFIHNAHVDIGTGSNKYRYKYPFLHFINNEPIRVSDDPTRKKSEYPILVDKTIKILKGTMRPTDKQYNQVVKQIDKAMIFIKRVSNGNLAENRMKLPSLLHDTMIEHKLPLTVEDLPLGVYNLEKFMRRKLMIQ